MRRLLALMLFGLLAVALIPALALAQGANYYWLQVRDELDNPITSGVTCHVLTISTMNTAPTIYTNVTLATTATNPITGDGSGLCTWYGPTSTATYDVVVYHQRGIARLEAVSTTDHLVRINKYTPWKQVRFPFSQNITETNTGLALPQGALVLDLLIETTTAVANAQIHVGLLSTESGGSLTGFANGAAISTAGFLRPQAATATFSSANCTARTYYNTNTRGTLLADFQTGSCTGGNGHTGLYREFPYSVTSGGAKTLSYQTSPLAAAGYVHIFYIEGANR